MKYKPLVRNNDFIRTYKQGKNHVHPFIVLYINKNRVGYTRVGITCSKKIGNAVVRNRAKRVIAAALYETLPQNIGGFDLVFVARGQTAHIKSSQLVKSLFKLFTKAGIQTKKQKKE